MLRSSTALSIVRACSRPYLSPASTLQPFQQLSTATPQAAKGSLDAGPGANENACPGTSHRSPTVNKLNRVVAEYPLPSAVTHLALSYACFGISLGALDSAGFDFPALAVAAVLTRATKMARYPLDVTLAVTLARWFPATNSLKLAPLLGVLPKSERETQPPPPETRPKSAVETKLENFAARYLEGPINKYGAPFLLTRWITGLGTISMMTALVHGGIDVAAMLESTWFFESTSPGTTSFFTGKASAFAGATVVNTVALPVRLYLVAHLTEPVYVATGIPKIRQDRGS